ncbi:sensor histidine kinase [Ornithinibacillus halophilus]|uniref:Sensor histidine kinase n=1 Tax=Ornithinibacillus halophilus TaxID=930117 RepID=A0A1M5F698_9BACI|nr:sensor histidine kinase [Ornithinibacillus halophilus]SHF87007.1 two-component system, NarL family, sensor histidine kinase LiaS [Ornithinibacillus halophilus]
MNTIIRQTLTAILVGVIITITVVGITFLAFPLEDWKQIIESDIGEVPYLVVLFLSPIVIGTISGITNALFWRQRIKHIDKQLNDIVKDQAISFDTDSYKELKPIIHSVEKIQEKIRQYTEHAQRLATQRANEREKSLQDIVIQERNRLARELHDSVSQQLFAASMMMSAINETNPPEDEGLRRQLELMEKMIHQSQLEMRALLLHLRPVALKGKSIQEGMEELLMELTQKVPMKVQWKIESFHMDKGIEDQLFRILQESVSNTLRHAEATKLEVMLIERDNTIIFRVVDDGIGFDKEKIRTTSSYGLSNMEERAHEVGGSLKIISLPQQGTKLEVKVPSLRKEGQNDD